MKHLLTAAALLAGALPAPAPAAEAPPTPPAPSEAPTAVPAGSPSIEPLPPRARRQPANASPEPSPVPTGRPTPALVPPPSAVPPAAPSEAPAAVGKPSPSPAALPATRPPATGSRRTVLVPSLVQPPAPPRRPASLLDDLVFDVEAGVLGFLQNDQRYGPPGTGTPYNRSTVALDRNLFAAQRTSFEARAFDRHTLIFLYAPVDVTTRVRLDGDLTFRDETFPKGTVVDHRYLFDGVRATYLYRFFEGHGLKLEGGATLGVRNAEVSLRSANGERFSAERDIGPVPALRGRARYDTPHGFYALLDVDAGGTPPGTRVQGGILDSALTLGVPLQTGLDGTLRLRYLAGGADVPFRDIVNWAQFASASAGFRFSPRFFWGHDERR